MVECLISSLIVLLCRFFANERLHGDCSNLSGSGVEKEDLLEKRKREIPKIGETLTP